MTDDFDKKLIHARIRLKLHQMKNTTHRELLRLKPKWNPLLLQIVNLFHGTNFFTNSEFSASRALKNSFPFDCYARISRSLEFFFIWMLH